MSRIIAILAAILATSCYRNAGTVQTDSYERGCGGQLYRDVTYCDAVVGPWPTMALSYKNCVTITRTP
jgi:hypothetical protein